MVRSRPTTYLDSLYAMDKLRTFSLSGRTADGARSLT
ncbi:Adenylosuccinate synthetase [Frankliniella fusca]|uniref:Adenylosuccinate synthetase n=1 Tax=Frankliniella fusca TaxID=407009 RepID=A0AAE1GSD6_9NEOP|nr:Adenylosuccinate synthetase [Frankliniella fusca]